jgi:TolA-binding protein
MKGNLEHSALPTAEEMKLYQDGKLESLRSHEIELLAQENPLLAEALEGYSTVPAYHMLPGITSAISNSAGMAATSAAAAVKIATPWWHLNGWIIGVAVGTTAAVGTVLVMDKDDQPIANNQSTQPTSIQQEIASEISEGVSTTDQKTTPYTDHHYDASTSVRPSDAGTLSTQQVVAGSPLADETSIAAPSAERLEELGSTQDAEPIILPPVSPSDFNTLPEELPVTKNTMAILITKILNYKVADYSAFRAENWEKFSVDDIGVQAKFASIEEKNQYLKENPEKSIPYIEYITRCIKAYDDDKYKLSIDRFSSILEEYPDDVNGLFYSGMSHFNLKEFDKAISYFTKVEKNFINTFDEESFFYHAKSLKALGKIDEANSLFVKVVHKNGFYKEHAIKEME